MKEHDINATENETLRRKNRKKQQQKYNGRGETKQHKE